MAKKKTPREERAVILTQPHKRPYGVKVRIHLRTGGAIGSVEEVCVSLNTGAFLSISPTRTAPWEGGKKYIVTLEGFPTAASAEASGRRLVQALLWMAISTDAPLRLEYLSYEPAAVFERNRSAGATCEAYGEVSYAPSIVLGELHDAYALLKEPNEKLLLSMEIFCAARLESSQRAVFLALVSALEPLAQEALLGEEVNQFVAECITLLRTSSSIPQELRASLDGRLGLLRQESLRQALKRLTRETLPDQPEAPSIVDDAYALRSQLIHSGVPVDLDVDLESESRSISAIIRDIYANLLGRPLARPSSG
jgi:hypothetical protein